jgi:SAM-dependent methyltransferase
MLGPVHLPAKLMHWTAESLSDLATAYWKSQALMAGVQTGLFDALPGGAEAVAKRVGSEVRTTQMLLEALTAMGLVVRKGDTFSLEDSAAPLLRSDGAAALGRAIEMNRGMYELWSRLPQCVRSGQPVIGPQSHLGEDKGRTREFVLGMHARGLALLPPVAEALDLTGVRTLLDVGAGPGTLARMLCRLHPDLEATLVDLPGITAVARELTAADSVAARVRHVQADYLVDELPRGFEAVVYSGALHQHSPGQAEAILAKLAGCLAPGGRLFVVDLMLNDDRSGPAFSALFGLNMALISPAAHMHSPVEVLRVLKGLGLVELTSRAVPGGIYQLVSGRVRGL